MSSKGALLAMAVKARAADPLDWMPQRVYLPQAAIREDLPWKKARKPFDRNFVHPKEKDQAEPGSGRRQGPRPHGLDAPRAVRAGHGREVGGAHEECFGGREGAAAAA